MNAPGQSLTTNASNPPRSREVGERVGVRGSLALYHTSVILGELALTAPLSSNKVARLEKETKDNVRMHLGAPADATDLFTQGSREYAAGHFEQAAANFNQSVAAAPSVGAWQNLGNAQWQCGETGLAILAWERAQWLDPLNPHSRENLRFARKTRLLEAPELSWPEICSTWLPVNAWPWVAALSFWLAVSMVMLPGIFRWRKAGWHQALAAAGFAIFLLTIPAMIGVHSRTKIGVVLTRDTPLRLTPTSDAQSIARLAAGETARLEHERERYLFIRTATASGWIDRAQFALIARDQ